MGSERRNRARRPAGAAAVAFWLAAAAGVPAIMPPPSRHHPGFPVMGMVPLGGDQLLLWHGDGRAQLRSTAGEWTDVFRLPVHAIIDIQPDPEGFLVTGSLKPGRSVTLLLTARGEERARWEMTADTFALVVDTRGRHAVTRTGTVALLADGKLGTPEPPPGGDAPTGTTPPTVIRYGDVTVVCRGADLSLEHSRSGRCERRGPAGWHYESNFLAPPLACGKWLMLLDGSLYRRVSVLSLATGKIEGRIATTIRPVYACAGPDELVLGDQRLALLSLPEGRPRWTLSPGGPGKGGVAALAVMESFIAYQVDGSPDVILFRRSGER
jgi:hypothetical protein